MRKMVFSAVALVAFSFTGMANEVKEEHKVIEVEIIEARVLSCVTIAAIQTMVASEAHSNDTGNDWDSWTYNFVYETYYAQCSN
jgi:hypothetical protein